jgi:single-strand DNA-binding protein
MSNGNTVTVVGNVVREPELRFTNAGLATASFAVAVNRRRMNQQTQEWEENTSFFDVVCWRELAENASGSLEKGSRVIVTGRLEQRSWESNEGEKRSRIQIVADDLGVSVRWATVTAVKNERRPGNTNAMESAGSPNDSGIGSYAYEEEPF